MGNISEKDIYKKGRYAVTETLLKKPIGRITITITVPWLDHWRNGEAGVGWI